MSRGDRKHEKLVFRCFAYPSRRGGRWDFVAVCIDLSLVTRRPRFEGARKSLNDAVRGYVEAVAEEAETLEEFTALVHRPVGLWPYGLLYRVLPYVGWVFKLLIKLDALRFDESVPANQVKMPPSAMPA